VAKRRAATTEGADSTSGTETPKKTRKARAPRLVNAGDISPDLSPEGIENHRVTDLTASRRQALEVAVRDIITRGTRDISATARALEAIVTGASDDDVQALLRSLQKAGEALKKPSVSNPDEELADDWREGGYPYKHLMLRKNYERQKYGLQVELLKLQAWVKETGQRVVILFEGRDAAGKGGTIKRFMEHLKPRGARVISCGCATRKTCRWRR